MCNPRMAACGVDCNACAQYKITMEQDRPSAELLVGWFRCQGWIGADEGAEAVLRKAPLCKGCWDITADCFWQCGCGALDFRVCCTERQILHCGECGDFPCADYRAWVDWHESHREAMERLQEKGKLLRSY